MKKKKFGRLIACLIITLLVFIGLLYIEKAITTPNGKVSVYLAKDEIKKGIIVTDENFDILFEPYVGDGKIEVSNAIKDKESIIDKVINTDLSKGVVISEINFSDRDNALLKIKNPVECSIAVSQISEAVGGILRTGNLIDIEVIDSTTKEAISVLENAYVNKVFSSDGVEIKPSDTTPATTINIIIEKEDSVRLSKKLPLGAVRVTKKNNEEWTENANTSDPTNVEKNMQKENNDKKSNAQNTTSTPSTSGVDTTTTIGEVDDTVITTPNE